MTRATSSDSDGQPPPKKRARTSDNSDESGNKKARGRPRVDTQDATAADRRRTQIRLAQRAYRQRKETTISSLKDQNAQLHSIIEQMNDSFLRLNDSAVRSGCLQSNPALAHELKQVTETFVSLAKLAAEGIHESEEEKDLPVLDQTAEFGESSRATGTADPCKPPVSQEPVHQHTEVGWGYSSVLVQSPPLADSTSSQQLEGQTSAMAFPTASDPPVQNAHSLALSWTRPRMTVGQVLDQSRPRTDDHPLPFGFVDLVPREPTSSGINTQTYSADMSAPEVTPPPTRLSSPPLLMSLNVKPVQSPWTYSHDEVTLAGRLNRATFEAGFRLLSNANILPARLSRVFRLSLPYTGVDTLHQRFKYILSLGLNEELELTDTPFYHLGGAGTHYPRKDSQGNVIMPANSWHVRTLGPFSNMVRMESSTDPTQTHDMVVDLTGFEGEWFDAHDVQGYLEEEKGVHIDPRHSFVEVLVDANDDDHATTNSLDTMSYTKTANMGFPFSSLPTSDPGLTHESSASESLSSNSTPITTADGVYGQNEAFGLDMGINHHNDFSKFNNFDVSAMFDQPLGLDLAPAYDAGMGASMAGHHPASFGDMSTLGLDLTGASMELLPVIKQKRRKVAWIDVSKLVDGIRAQAVCLGRRPGFRRKDVDTAFQASLIHAF